MDRAPALLVASLWVALRDGPVAPLATVADYVGRIVRDGYLDRAVFVDLVHDLGFGRLAGEDGFLELLAVEPVTLFRRPRSRVVGCYGTPCLLAADVASGLIRAEKLGLAVDPSALVEALRPALLAKPMLTAGEVDVLWHAQERHRSAPANIVADGPRGPSRSEEIKTANGYCCEGWINPAGDAHEVFVRAPRHRRRRVAA